MGFSAADRQENVRRAASVSALMAEAGLICLTALISVPHSLPRADTFLNQGFNRWLAPLLPPLCLSMFITARPKPRGAIREKTVSVVIPARNEAGNIEAVVARTPTMGEWMELIFVEGNSKDDTWAEIQRIKAEHPHTRIKSLQQEC